MSGDTRLDAGLVQKADGSYTLTAHVTQSKAEFGGDHLYTAITDFAYGVTPWKTIWDTIAGAP